MLFLKQILQCNIILFYTLPIFAQIEPNVLSEDYILENLADLDNSLDFSANESLIFLEALKERPIAANLLKADHIDHFIFLSFRKRTAIQKHLKMHKALLSPYELMAVEGLTVQEATFIAETFLKPATKSNQYPPAQLLKEGKVQMLHFNQIRFPIDSTFLGSPVQSLTRFSYQFPGYFNIGLTIEKDAGETSITDHLGFHAYWNHPIKWVKKIALGDYKIRLGQGLLLNDGLSQLKGSYLGNLKLSQATISPHQSQNEYFFQRGLASTFTLSDRLESSVFISFRNLDASVQDQENPFIRTIRQTELHRTNTENKAQSTVQRQLIGGNMQYTIPKGAIRLNALHATTSLPFVRTRPYQQFWSQGSNQFFTSIDYEWQHKNLSFFGEIAMQGLGSMAVQNNFVLTASSFQLFLMQRYYDKKFQNDWGNTFSENATVTDEEGYYLGFAVQLNERIDWVSYVDFWNHHWLRFRIARPSNGFEYFSKIRFAKRKSWEAYLQFRFRQKLEIVDDSSKDTGRTQTRFQYQTTSRSAFSYKLRLEWLRLNRAAISNSFLLLNDFKYQFKRVRTTLRIAYNTSEDFQNRFFAYEPNITHQYNFISYYGRGIRTALLAKINISKTIRLESKVGFTYSSLSSRTNNWDLGFQLKAAW